MEEIPVEYNIIIEALSSVVQNHQQEGNGDQANFEFVVINNPAEGDEQAPAQSTLDCVEQTHDEQGEHEVETQVTFESEAVIPTSTSDVGVVSTEVQDVETTQAAETILPNLPREKTHKCDVCNKAFLHAGRNVVFIHHIPRGPDQLIESIAPQSHTLKASMHGV